VSDKWIDSPFLVGEGELACRAAVRRVSGLGDCELQGATWKIRAGVGEKSCPASCQQPNDMLDERANRNSAPMTDDSCFAACVMHHFASGHAVYSRARVLMAVRRA
jgi:hypothetical protein